DEVGGVLRLLHLLDELQEGDAGGLAVEERVRRHHVAQQVDELPVLGELHVGVEHRERAARLELLLLELRERLLHRRQLADRGHGVAPREQLPLLLEPERRRDERGVLGDHRHSRARGFLPAGDRREEGNRQDRRQEKSSERTGRLCVGH
ncbi:MAG: hypothetical protein ACK55I_40190, partial [bacterium]